MNLVSENTIIYTGDLINFKLGRYEFSDSTILKMIVDKTLEIPSYESIKDKIEKEEYEKLMKQSANKILPILEKLDTILKEEIDFLKREINMNLMEKESNERS